MSSRRLLEDGASVAALVVRARFWFGIALFFVVILGGVALALYPH